MKNSVEIVAFVKPDAQIKELLKEFSSVSYIEDHNSLLDMIENLNYMNSYTLIIDLEHCLNKDDVIDHCVKKNLQNKGFSIILNSDTIIPLEMKIKFYNLDFKGMIDSQTGDKRKLLNHVLNRSNLHAATFRNNSVRAMLEFHQLYGYVKNAINLLDYLVCKYKIAQRDALNIHLIVSSLTVAFKLEKITDMGRVLHTIYKSKSIDKLYQNYRHPKSNNESFIAIILKLLNQTNFDKYLSEINMKNVNQILLDEIEDIYEKKFIYISSLQDINSFWEQMSNVILQKHPLDNTMLADSFLSTLYFLLLQSLIRVDYMRAHAEFDDDGNLSVYIDQFEDKNDHLEHYIESHREYLDLVTLKENKIVMTLENPKKVLINNPPIENIQNRNKISAQEFLQNYIIDRDALDDLAENQEDINTLLFLEEHISQNTIESVYLIIDKYVNILLETVEFEKLAIALSSLSQVLKETIFDNIEESRKETLRFYIHGLTDDLKNWQQYIFVEQNTPDIHYMDDSLLENCLTIKNFINSKQEEDNNAEDEDDLEFF